MNCWIHLRNLLYVLIYDNIIVAVVLRNMDLTTNYEDELTNEYAIMHHKEIITYTYIGFDFHHDDLY